MAKKILAWSDSAGQFYREIGKRENGKAFRFYLGTNETQAMATVPRLEGLWRGVEERWRDFKGDDAHTTPFPCWDELTLTLGRAIAKGEWTVKVEPPDEGPEEGSGPDHGSRAYQKSFHREVFENLLERTIGFLGDILEPLPDGRGHILDRLFHSTASR